MGEFFDWLRNCQLVEKVSATWIYLFVYLISDSSSYVLECNVMLLSMQGVKSKTFFVRVLPDRFSLQLCTLDLVHNSSYT